MIAASSSKYLAGLFLALAAGLSGQSPVRGPISGFVFDVRSASIRPINGMPGSSVLGAPVDLPFAIGRAVFSPGGGCALAVDAHEEALVYWVCGLSANPVYTPVAHTISGSQIAFNNTGTAALLYSRPQKAVQVINGLPGNPRASSPVDISGLGEVTALALAPSGAGALVGARTDGVGALSSIRLDGTPDAIRFLASFSPTAIRYINRGRDAVVADQEQNRVVLVNDVDGSMQLLPLAGEREGVNRPADLAVTRGERELLVANSGGRNILSVDLTLSRGAQAIPLSVIPTRLESLQGEEIFILNELESGPLWLLETTSETNAFFVPVESHD